MTHYLRLYGKTIVDVEAMSNDFIGYCDCLRIQ